MPRSATLSKPADQADRQWRAGFAHSQGNRWDAALVAFRAAARLNPKDCLYALNHANALLKLGRLADARAEAVRAQQLDPADTKACALVAECLMREHRYPDAVKALRDLSPDATRDVAYHTALGLALHRAGRPKEAVAAYFDALALKMSDATLHYNLGLCFSDMDMKKEAVTCFNTGLILGLGKHELSVRALGCYYARGAADWSTQAEDEAALSRCLRAVPADASMFTTPFAHAVLSADRSEVRHAAALCARHFARDYRPLPARKMGWSPSGKGRLRVGYVSGDFHQHATSILMAEMLEHHDRDRFEITLYSHGADDKTVMRKRIEAAGEHFIDVRTMSDAEVAQRIRADGIDLLIDLKGHTRDTRIGLFAYRPSPVQVSFLGFPGTTGAEYIDYMIGDPIVTPLSHAPDYSEKIAQMPICYQPNDRMRQLLEAPSRESQGLPATGLVLCGINQPYKISPEVFDSWCRLLKALPGAVLWLLEWNPEALPNLRREAVTRDIDPARIVAAPRVSPADHVARLQLADIFIDTWPCNAHTTASDALWAGVPVVTLPGETFASRVAASLLNGVGMTELSCSSVEHYEQTILDLAADPQRRAALRARLIEGRKTAPLFDSLRFTRDIESLYLRMAEREFNGQRPDHLPAVA